MTGPTQNSPLCGAITIIPLGQTAATGQHTRGATTLVLHLQKTYSHASANRGTFMQPTAFQKIAYAVLIALMFGVTTGLIGGL